MNVGGCVIQMKGTWSGNTFGTEDRMDKLFSELTCASFGKEVCCGVYINHWHEKTPLKLVRVKDGNRDEALLHSASAVPYTCAADGDGNAPHS
jgi:hypothetical protein